MNGPLVTSLSAARWGHCLVNFEDKIFSTGGEDGKDATSNVWQFNPANNFAKADRPVMKKKREFHGCGIVHSIHHSFRPLLIVAGSYSGTGAKNSEYWDFTLAGSTWQLCGKSCSFFSYIYSIILKTIFKFLAYEMLLCTASTANTMKS